MQDELGQDVARAAFRLAASYPASDLGNPSDPLDDLIYIILSGQTNESNYQEAFGNLKRAFPGWVGLSAARTRDVVKLIAVGGLAQQKAEYIKALLVRIEADFGRASLSALSTWATPDAEQYLAGLPGVGVKTARCVLMYTLHRDVFPADVHCLRVMERLGWLEWGGRRAELLANCAQDLVPPALRRPLHIGLVQHGRQVCSANSPKCQDCCLSDLCRHGDTAHEGRPTVVDLCCGAGGFSWGFMQSGFDIRLGVDQCRHALDTFAANIPGAKTLRADVTDANTVNEIRTILSKKRPSVVIAGPPCQGFSRAGRRDATDPRNAILRASMKLAVALKPDVIVVENVLNVRGERFVHHFDKTMGVARRAGYFFMHAIVRADAFGVPQSRQRIVLIAAKVGDKSRLRELMRGLGQRPVVENMTVAAALHGIPHDPSNAGHVRNHTAMSHSARVIAKIKRIEPGQGPLSYRKLHPDRPAPTLICGHRALPCHYATPRTITAREAARIQGFPDDYHFAGPHGNQMLQVANAVPPRLALGIADAVHAMLDLDRPDAVDHLIDAVLRRVSVAPESVTRAPASRNGMRTPERKQELRRAGKC